MALFLVATCALGLEELVATELAELGIADLSQQRGAVTFRGSWPEVARANQRLRTANRVLVELASWPAADGDALAAGAEALVTSRQSWDGLTAAALFDPRRSFALTSATASRSALSDRRWIALKTKDGLVDGQRRRYGKRGTVERGQPDLSLRLRLQRDRATLLLDCSGESLSRRGYRRQTVEAAVREQLAAAMPLAAGWPESGAPTSELLVVDPMCGSGTLLAEAALIALGVAPGQLRDSWPLDGLLREGATAALGQRLAAVRQEPVVRRCQRLRLVGADRSSQAIAATRANLATALGDPGQLERAGVELELHQADAFSFEPPAPPIGGSALLVVNPPYGEQLAEEPDQWRRLGDLMKQSYTGYTAAVLAGDKGKGKHIGLRPRRRLPVKNGPLDARILVFDLY